MTSQYSPDWRKDEITLWVMSHSLSGQGCLTEEGVAFIGVILAKINEKDPSAAYTLFKKGISTLSQDEQEMFAWIKLKLGEVIMELSSRSQS